MASDLDVDQRLRLDVTDVDSVAAAFAEAGEVDILVSNVGVPTKSGAGQADPQLVRKRCWSIARRHVDLADQVFAQAGYLVAIDGQIQTSSATNPFPLLRDSMSEHQWLDVARTIRDELEPGTRLYRMLREAYETDRQARAS